MFQRLILLWGACLALVLSISSCGGDSEDFKPVNKTGALDGGAPDVVLFVLDDSHQDPAQSWRQNANAAGSSGGVVSSAAYSRFPTPEKALSDLLGLGQLVSQDASAEGHLGSPLFVRLREGGYTTHVVPAYGLADFLGVVSEVPRFAIVKLASDLEKAAAHACFFASEVKSKQDMLTIWTALPLGGKGDSLTEEHLHVPLVFSMPGTLAKKQEHTQVVSLADVGVTILDLCGLLPEGTAHHDHEGASFARILQKKPLAWRGFVLAKTASGDGWIRSTRWRLSHSAAKGLTLSHIEEDPSNTRDDSNLPGAKAQLEGLGRRLDAWLK